MAIPKIIHQTWKTKDIPRQYAGFVESVKRYNPDYQYRLWTDENNRGLIKDLYPWFLRTFDAYKHGIERADAVRYFILYTYGGVYIDLDMECLKPIDSLLRNADLFFSIEAGPFIQNQVVSNAFMACARKNLFFLHIMKNLEGFIRQDITYHDVFNNTGPDMVTKQYFRNRTKFDFRIIGLHDICPIRVIHQHPFFKGYTLEEIRKQKKLFLIHHCTNSWNIQLKCPDTEIEGYALFKHHDIIGYDIDYVDYVDGMYAAILSECNNNPEAIGFNYNGFIKGTGGKLRRIEERNDWHKEGIDPWIYIKKDKVSLVL